MTTITRSTIPTSSVVIDEATIKLSLLDERKAVYLDSEDGAAKAWQAMHSASPKFSPLSSPLQAKRREVSADVAMQTFCDLYPKALPALPVPLSHIRRAYRTDLIDATKSAEAQTESIEYLTETLGDSWADGWDTEEIVCNRLDALAVLRTIPADIVRIGAALMMGEDITPQQSKRIRDWRSRNGEAQMIRARISPNLAPFTKAEKRTMAKELRKAERAAKRAEESLALVRDAAQTAQVDRQTAVISSVTHRLAEY